MNVVVLKAITGELARHLSFEGHVLKTGTFLKDILHPLKKTE